MARPLQRTGRAAPAAAADGRPPAPAPVRFSVVIATLRRPDALAAALESLAATAPRPLEAVVVDGEGSVEVRRLVEEVGRRTGLAVRYLASAPGLPRQRNAGLDAAAGDVVVFADDDVVVPPELFASLAAAYADPGVVGATVRVHEPGTHRVVGSRSRLRRLLGGAADGSFTRFGYPRYVAGGGDRDVEFMSGCLMSARRWAAQAARFDERLDGYALAEDEDFSVRVARLGRIRYLAGTTVEHRKRGFVERDARAFNRMLVLNRTYLFRKNFTQTRRARLEFGLFVAALLVHRLANGDRAGARGVLDGIRAARRTASR